MIYDLERGFAFIHIPRCGGIALTTALAERCPGATVDTRADRHLRGRYLRDLVGHEPWERLHRFATIRDPWSACASDYRLTLRDARDAKVESASADWLARLERMRAGCRFERFVEEEWLGEYSGIQPGGLWRTWCEDEGGRSLGIQPLLFERLAECWQLLCVRLGLSLGGLPWLNHAPGPQPEWTPGLRQRVGDRCGRDLELFGFTP